MRITNRTIFKPKARSAYKIENKADEATVYLYDEISWFGISAEQFVKDLNATEAKTINIRINSPGGSVFDGTAIYNAIKSHKSRTVAHIDGLAASISSVIALAADEIRMGENAFLMIHNPWSIVIGDAQTMREEADLLDKVSGTIAKTYMDKTGKEENEILDMMAAETWLTAKEAKEVGFIDFIDNAKEEKASTLFDLSAFANVPKELIEEKQELTAKDAEKALRDVGFSKKQARSIVAEGMPGFRCDADSTEGEKKALRDVDSKKQTKKDRATDLLIRAEKLAPTPRQEK